MHGKLPFKNIDDPPKVRGLVLLRGADPIALPTPGTCASLDDLARASRELGNLADAQKAILLTGKGPASTHEEMLAAASRELRQPLQTLSLLVGLLAKTAHGEKQVRLVSRFGETLDVMSRVLDALLEKVVKVPELAPAIQNLLVPPAPTTATDREAPTIYVVDDDSQLRDSLRLTFEEHGYIVFTFASGEAFLKSYRAAGNQCLLIDFHLPGMKGTELLQALRAQGHNLPAIMIAGHGDVSTAVGAMKAGVSDFIEKPIRIANLLESVERVLEHARDLNSKFIGNQVAANKVSGLTRRQLEIMNLVLAGHPSKNIAADLGISQRTVENHRASIMRKTGSKSLPALARIAIAAEQGLLSDRRSRH